MTDKKESTKNLFNESQKENEEQLKSENILLKSSRVTNAEKDKEKDQINSNENNNEKAISKKYEESPSRYYILVAYCFCIFASGFQWLSFTSLPYFPLYYELSQWKVDFFSLIYIIEYLVLFIPEMVLS